MEAVPAVSSSVERSSQNPLISLAPRLYTISHPNKCSKLENDEISGLIVSPDDHLGHNLYCHHGLCEFRAVARSPRIKPMVALGANARVSFSLHRQYARVDDCRAWTSALACLRIVPHTGRLQQGD